jgi:hypothetical protein
MTAVDSTLLEVGYRAEESPSQMNEVQSISIDNCICTRIA